MRVQDRIRQLRTQLALFPKIEQLRTELALCRRLGLGLAEGGVPQAVEDYASALEIRLWLLLISTNDWQASPW
ncbi:hypothetical protein [Rhodopila globiformis]|uniref:Uncharacterized protein n=1 Tax=Rhodopila globiformis TaxID=1071 RepID=A0A2S6N4Z0_RHOGL|nr:hypothetical protein [Rhodopila globiformis]PPQ29669.1 hypothetical protein CCS01_20980 [Rhodopila globiformis]